MDSNKIRVIICEQNQFLHKELTHCISTVLSESSGMIPEFSDCVFDYNAKMIFMAENTLSVANSHYLNRRMAARPLNLFVIHDKPSKSEFSLLNRVRYKLNHYTSLYRNQSVAEITDTIRDRLALRSGPNTVWDSSCATRNHNNLTRRETQVLRYLARGLRNGAVARSLHISENTVSAHKRNIMFKLNMIRTAELNYWLLQEGWCDSWRTSGKITEKCS